MHVEKDATAELAIQPVSIATMVTATLGYSPSSVSKRLMPGDIRSKEEEPRVSGGT